MRRLIHPGRAALRGWCRSLLLALTLVCAQQGALLHELSHHTPPAAHEPDDGARSTAPCGVCLAFAAVQAPAGLPAAAFAPLDGLRFDLAAAPALRQRAAGAPAQRNRGPPAAG